MASNLKGTAAGKGTWGGGGAGSICGHRARRAVLLRDGRGRVHRAAASEAKGRGARGGVADAVGWARRRG